MQIIKLLSLYFLFICQQIMPYDQYVFAHQRFAWSPTQKNTPAKMLVSGNTYAHHNNYSSTNILTALMRYIENLNEPQTQTLTQPSPYTQKQSPQSIPTPVEPLRYNASQIELLEQQIYTYQQLPEWVNHHEVLNLRNKAIHKLKLGHQSSSVQYYALSTQAMKYCNKNLINIDTLTSLEGDALQHEIHHEFIIINEKTSEAINIAKKLNFRKTNYYSRGQPVFKKGTLYITPDVDCHSGGIWKMADSIENLKNKKTRLDTYDIYLNRIGD